MADTAIPHKRTRATNVVVSSRTPGLTANMLDTAITDATMAERVHSMYIIMFTAHVQQVVPETGASTLLAIRTHVDTVAIVKLLRMHRIITNVLAPVDMVVSNVRK
ncbi:uncharacterized protein LOC128221771 [Mya arenaria]|uniref:uncharacterized protein LOC128221771 n=1 Tax=Mya arenaria TaxID=6604 RepID=UPI0022E675BF|nr:uncharacterized protein LOC128221771 [Mya arenaria]